MKAPPARVGQSAEAIRQSIVDPNDVISEGFAEGVMPPYSAVPEDQLDALVEYLVAETGG